MKNNILKDGWKKVLEEMRKNEGKMEEIVVDSTTGFIETNSNNDEKDILERSRRA